MKPTGSHSFTGSLGNKNAADNLAINCGNQQIPNVVGHISADRPANVASMAAGVSKQSTILDKSWDQPDGTASLTLKSTVGAFGEGRTSMPIASDDFTLKRSLSNSANATQTTFSEVQGSSKTTLLTSPESLDSIKTCVKPLHQLEDRLCNKTNWSTDKKDMHADTSTAEIFHGVPKKAKLTPVVSKTAECGTTRLDPKELDDQPTNPMCWTANDAASDANKTNSNPAIKQPSAAPQSLGGFSGFTSAGGKQITLTEESWKKARALSEQVDKALSEEQHFPSETQTGSLSGAKTGHKNVLENAAGPSGNGDQVAKQMPTIGGFQSASGRAIKLSTDALDKSSKWLNSDTGAADWLARVCPLTDPTPNTSTSSLLATESPVPSKQIHKVHVESSAPPQRDLSNVPQGFRPFKPPRVSRNPHQRESTNQHSIAVSSEQRVPQPEFAVNEQLTDIKTGSEDVAARKTSNVEHPENTVKSIGWSHFK